MPFEDVSSAPPPFDFYVVLDFEAAFNKPDGPGKVMEIIEFPSVIIDARTHEIRSEFQRYVRPVIHPTMHPEVTKLTGITQATVDAAQPFPHVFQEYRRWLLESGLSALAPAPAPPAPPTLGPDANRAERKQAAIAAAALPARPFIPHQRSRSFCFVTCGDWDIKTMLPVQFENEGGLGKLLASEHPAESRAESFAYVEAMMSQWINLKDTFNNTVPSLKQPVRGMTCMLRELQLPLIGRHHSGIDDCRNIAAVLQALLKRRIRVDVTNTRAVVTAKRGTAGMIPVAQRNELIRRGDTRILPGRLREFHGDLALPFAPPNLSDRVPSVAAVVAAPVVPAAPTAAPSAARTVAAAPDDDAEEGPVAAAQPVPKQPKRKSKSRLQ